MHLQQDGQWTGGQIGGYIGPEGGYIGSNGRWVAAHLQRAIKGLDWGLNRGYIGAIKGLDRARRTCRGPLLSSGTATPNDSFMRRAHSAGNFSTSSACNEMKYGGNGGRGC